MIWIVSLVVAAILIYLYRFIRFYSSGYITDRDRILDAMKCTDVLYRYDRDFINQYKIKYPFKTIREMSYEGLIDVKVNPETNTIYIKHKGTHHDDMGNYYLPV